MATALTRQQKLDLVERWGAAARVSQEQFGVPASITVAQAILESGWGQTDLAVKGNNFFGIKDTEFCEGYIEFPTAEYVNGKVQIVRAKFEKYPTEERSFEHHARLISSADRYQPAMEVAKDPGAFALQLLACGYSTEPRYPKLLMDLVRQYNLTRFDAPAAEEAATA